jgi:hypothetical protein
VGKAEDDLREDLIGSELYSVVFVRDYVQLYLDAEPGLPAQGNWQIIVNLYVLPTLRAPSIALASGDQGWADALRTLIDKKIASAALNPGVEFAISFDTGEELHVSLRPGDRLDPPSHEAIEVMHGPDFWAY